MAQVARTENGYLCRRDGSLMYVVYESEKTMDNKLRVSIAYKCPVCGFRVEAETLEMTRGRDSYTLTRTVRRLPA